MQKIKIDCRLVFDLKYVRILWEAATADDYLLTTYRAELQKTRRQFMNMITISNKFSTFITDQSQNLWILIIIIHNKTLPVVEGAKYRTNSWKHSLKNG